MPDFLLRHWGEIAKRERMKMRHGFYLAVVPISLEKIFEPYLVVELMRR
jgi:hypothetical protein